ncbi:zeta toxin family protein [Xanthomonas campestris]|uniref:zeta toxin family protein n=1 Tax=Xanthomonas campestris TaxID=339 RepID=UPI002B237668|nr:zeta toxin family protein [Xanthomonas campestris]MEA9776927.1 zeta toxin family protein [Xanthomonas campestris pv. raphani]
MSGKDKDDAAARKAAYDAELPQITLETVEDALTLTTPVNPATVIFTGGQPGSGKSKSIVDKAIVEYADKGGIAVLDPDELRPLFAQARREQEAGEYSSQGYEAAGTLAYNVSLQLAEEQRNILRDGSLRDAEWPMKEIGELKRHDYQVEIHIAAVHRDVSHARTEQRRQLDAAVSDVGFGRKVDRSFHDQAAAGVVQTAGQLWDMPDVNRFVVYDANGSVVLDRSRDDRGEWVDKDTGKPHAGPAPSTIIEERQTQATAADLVMTADAWRRARESLDGRAAPASELEIAVLDRNLNGALDAVRGNAEASEHANQDEYVKLRALLLQRESEPLRAQAEAWKRDGQEARNNWPTYAPAFDKADELVRKNEDLARAAGRIVDGDKLRQCVADKIAGVRERTAEPGRAAAKPRHDEQER